MFPPAQLEILVRCTNTLLEEKEDNSSRANPVPWDKNTINAIWVQIKSKSLVNYISLRHENPPSFGPTDMKRPRFDDTWQYLQWSDHPKERHAGMSSEKYWWKLVDGFVAQFNKHRARSIIPSEYICVDESISRWYGQGGK
jgi:hypothetical protein